MSWYYDIDNFRLRRFLPVVYYCQLGFGICKDDYSWRNASWSFQSCQALGIRNTSRDFLQIRNKHSGIPQLRHLFPPKFVLEAGVEELRASAMGLWERSSLNLGYGTILVVKMELYHVTFTLQIGFLICFLTRSCSVNVVSLCKLVQTGRWPKLGNLNYVCRFFPYKMLYMSF